MDEIEENIADMKMNLESLQGKNENLSQETMDLRLQIQVLLQEKKIIEEENRTISRKYQETQRYLEQVDKIFR